MKILNANNFYYLRGGSERVLFEEQTILRKMGHEVESFSRKTPENYESKYCESFAEYTPEQDMTFSDKVRGVVNVFYNRNAAKHISNVIDDFRPDIIHAHNIYGGLSTSIIDMARKKNVPCVITLHDYKLLCPSYLMLNHGKVCEDCLPGKFYKCLLNRCHRGSVVSSAVYTLESYYNRIFKKYDYLKFYICPSNFIKEKMFKNGIRKEKLVHIPNFVDLGQYEYSHEVGSYVLYAGRLSNEKGVMTLLHAFNEIKNVPLKIVGDGSMRDDALKYAEDNAMSNVEFCGYKSGQELKNLFRNSACIVIPSEWYENAPMTIIESFAYGKPVVGSRIGGIPEMVDEGVTGFLFDDGCKEELKKKITDIWNDKKTLADMGKASREKAKKEYASEKHYEKLISLYEKAIN